MLKVRFLFAAAVLLLSSSVLAQRDVAGSADPQQLERFPLSWIVSFSEYEVPEYSLAVGPMKKLEGVIAPEKFVRLAGFLNRVTYRIPDNHSPADAFSFYKQQLRDINAEILFECNSRRCGSSNQWANNYFGVAELYGVDRTQFYLAAAIGSKRVALYTVKRGNRRIYLHLDLIEPLTQSAASIRDELDQQGFSWLESADQVQLLLELLGDDQSLGLLIVGYDQDRSVSETAQLVESSTRLANQLRQDLIAAGLSSGRLDAIGVGPAVPVSNPPSTNGIWIQKR